MQPSRSPSAHLEFQDEPGSIAPEDPRSHQAMVKPHQIPNGLRRRLISIP